MRPKKAITIALAAVLFFVYFIFIYERDFERPEDVRDDIWYTTYEYMEEILVYSSPYEPMSEEQFQKYENFVTSYSSDPNSELTENENEILYHFRGLAYYAQQFRILYQECGECHTPESDEYLDKMWESELELIRIYDIDAVEFYNNAI
ncbi:hypothetical protein J2S74_001409 [Evansella vedderi]|uniref:Uncharacterized protein n=1 Tax=Evansella vedderi TaxID=38282 RepID=A0ABT9ZTJ9_9BACI|nr:hypothetical protein [Evansella vedderi]MDQ0254036.1 hypothetical protein [Evansella vedderi]